MTLKAGTKITLGVIFLALASIISLNIYNVDAGIDDWDRPSYNYKRVIHINQSGSTDLDDILVQVVLDTTGNYRSDCKSIVFVNESNSTLYYQFENHGDASIGCNTANTQFWVLMPNISATNSSIAVYYDTSDLGWGNKTGSLPSELIYWTSFGANTGSTLEDQTGQVGAADLVRTDWNTTDCQFGNCLNFSQGFADIPDDLVFDLVNNQIYTSGWFKLTEYQSNAYVGFTRSGTGSAATDDAWAYYFKTDDNTTHGAIYTGSTSTPKHTGGNNEYSYDEWFHYVMGYNGSHISTWINGEYKSQTARTGTPNTPNNKSAIGNSDWQFRIQYSISGKADEMIWWDGTWTDDEIKRIYEQDYYTVLSEQSQGSDNSPVTTLVTPADEATDSDGSVTFNCSATDDQEISNITLYHNETGTWHANSTNTSVTGTYDFAEFNLNFGTPAANETVLWNCLTTDNASQTDFGNANYSLNLDYQDSDAIPTSTQSTPADNALLTSRTVNFTYTPTDDNGFSSASLYYKPNETLKIAIFGLVGYEDPTTGDAWQQNVSTRLTGAITQTNTWGVDIVVGGGDIIDSTWGATPATCNGDDSENATRNLQEIIDIFNDTTGTFVPILGNHELCELNKDQIKAVWDRDENYTYMDTKGYRLIFLDSHNLDHGPGHKDGGTENLEPELGADQLAWIQELVTNSTMPAIIFNHALVSNFSSTSEWYVSDRYDFQSIVEADNSTAIMVVESNLHGEYNDSSSNLMYVNSGCFQDGWFGAGTEGNQVVPSTYLQLTIYPNNNTVQMNLTSYDYGQNTNDYHEDFRTNSTWEWGSKASNSSVMTNNTLNGIEVTLPADYGDVNYTWAVAVTDDNSQTTFSSNWTLQLDTTYPNPVFASPTPDNQTKNNATFTINVSTGETLNNCILEIYPEVVKNLGQDNENWEIGYNATDTGSFCSDNEHSYIGSGPSSPCFGGHNTDYRAYDLLDLSYMGITANVTNATYTFGLSNEGIGYNGFPEEYTTYVYIHHNASLNWDYDYCNGANESACWNETSNTDNIILTWDASNSTVSVQDNFTLDLTDIVNDELATNGGDDDVLLIFRTNWEGNYTAGDVTDGMDVWDGIPDTRFPHINFTQYAYENITMTTIGQYCTYELSLDLLPPNSTEFYFRVYANDTNGNMNVTEDRSWTYELQSPAASNSQNCDSCADCTAAVQNSSSGDTVTMADHITDATSDCIHFGGNDGIYFDCSGYKVSSTNGVGDGFVMNGADNNTIINCLNVSYFQSGMTSTAGNNTNNLTITNNHIYDTGGTGIILAGNDTIITDSNVTRAGGNGITLAGGNNTIQSLTLDDSDQSGIYITSGASYNTIYNIIAQNSDDYNIYMHWGDYNNISYNTMTNPGTGDYNLAVLYSANNISHNNITDCNGVYFTAITSTNFWNNEINCDTNSIDGTYTNSYNVTQSTATNILGYSGFGGNYWSAYTGIDDNEDGIGDTSHTLATLNIDYLPLIEPTYTFTSAVVNATGNTNYTFSAVAADVETIDITIDYDGNTPDLITPSVHEDLANTTVVTTNASVFKANASSLTAFTIQLTINSTAPAGSYSGNLTLTGGNSTTAKNISIDFTISANAANIDITNTTWSVAFTAGNTQDIYFLINNTGDYNATHCNMSYSGSVGSVSFDTSDFGINQSEPVQVKATFSGSSSGSDSSATISCDCVATASGGTDSDSVLGSISISAGGGGGGGGGDTTIIESNITLGYEVGDDICQTAAGENAFNSEDCRLDIAQNEIQFIVILIVILGIGYMVMRSILKNKKPRKSPYRFNLAG